MEERIKEIVSVFIKVPADQIGPLTAIDRRVMQSSILVHRMYAKLANEGLVVENYADIKVFGDLVKGSVSRGSSRSGQPEFYPGSSGSSALSLPDGSSFPSVSPLPVSSGGGIGIDIEEISALPLTDDFRKTEFYRMNFAASEIAYCILQPDPYASFTGLFAAKEAIIKADGRFRGRSFNTIVIVHSFEGKPVFSGFNVSISHSGSMAVAVAVPSAGEETRQGMYLHGQEEASVKTRLPVSWPAWIALALSAIALLIVCLH